MKKFFTLLGLVSITSLALFAKEYEVASPDGQIKVTVDAGKWLTWSVERGDEVLVAPSRLGLDIEGTKAQPGFDTRVKNVSRRSVDEVVVAEVPQIGRAHV